MPVQPVSPHGKKPNRPAPKKPVTKPVFTDNFIPGFCGLRPFAMFLHGLSGVGKTSFAAEFEDAGFVIDPQEQGILELIETRQCKTPTFVEESQGFDHLLTICENIAAEDNCKTAVFDSSTGFEKQCFAWHCDEYFDGDWTKHGFFNFQQGPKNAAKKDWPRFLDALNLIRASGKNVCLIGHSQVKTYENPEGPNYDRFVPYLDKETWQQTHRWASMVLFYNFHVELEKAGAKYKAKDSEDQRFIYTTKTPAFDAKNRYGLSPLIDAGDSGKTAYNAFQKEMLKAKQHNS